MIRPETIGIVPEGDAFLRGNVESVSFIGDRQRVIVTGAANRPLTVDAPNRINVRAGERIGLQIAPDAVRVLPKED
jgi:putative spermidine/putrescine transport system ATP-binding protein